MVATGGRLGQGSRKTLLTTVRAEWRRDRKGAMCGPVKGGAMGNHLYYGDNLTVLRESIADESVDLIYLDPPFNSNAGYNVLFKAPDGSGSAAQIEAFDDTWHWNDSAEAAFADVLRSGNGAAALPGDLGHSAERVA